MKLDSSPSKLTSQRTANNLLMLAFLFALTACGQVSVESLDVPADASEDSISDARLLDTGRFDTSPLDAQPLDVPDGGTTCNALCPGVCVDNVCIIDAPTEAVRCPDGFPCRVTCAVPNTCDEGITCGDGACSIECGGAGSCGAPIDCRRAESCVVRCGNNGTCQGLIECADDCQVECSGLGSCNAINCGVGLCDVACTQNSACSGLISAPAGSSLNLVCDAAGTCTAGVDCSEACGCQVECRTGACSRSAMCPPGCDSGSGCTRDTAVCDTCSFPDDR